MSKRGRKLKTTMRERIARKYGCGPWRRYRICILGEAADDWRRLFGCEPPGSWRIVGAGATMTGERRVWINGREVDADTVRPA